MKPCFVCQVVVVGHFRAKMHGCNKNLKTAWFILNIHQAPFTDRNSHLKTSLTSRTCQLLWHSITPSVSAITKVPCSDTAGHTDPLIGWFGLVKRIGFAVWNEMVSTSDRDHDSGESGLALSASSQLSSSQTKLCTCGYASLRIYTLILVLRQP